MTNTPTLTVRHAARAGHCSVSTIHRLIDQKKIAATQRRPGAHRVITATREQIVAAVKTLPRKTGYHRRTNGTQPPPQPKGFALTLALFLAIPRDTRESLFALLERFSIDELRDLSALAHTK